MSRFARRKDDSHKPIVEFAQAHGIVCFDVSRIANLGFDVICFDTQRRIWKPFEIKTLAESKARPGARKYSVKNRPVTATASKLTASEQKARSLAPIATVTTGYDLLFQMRQP